MNTLFNIHAYARSASKRINHATNSTYNGALIEHSMQAGLGAKVVQIRIVDVNKLLINKFNGRKDR